MSDGSEGKVWFWRLYGVNLFPANLKGWAFMLGAMAIFAIAVGGTSDAAIAKQGWEIKLRLLVAFSTLLVYFVVAYAKSRRRPKRK